MGHKRHQLPNADEIKDRVLSELRYHRENYEHEDITSHVEIERLVHVAADSTQADLDPELSQKLERRTNAVLRRLERDGLIMHWVSEDWYLTDVGMRYR